MASSSKLKSLENKVAIITGAGAGLGREYALALAAYGVKVIVNDYGGDLTGQRGSVDRAQKVVDEIVANGGTAIADSHDVSIEDETKAIVENAVKSFGTVHILVNNAAVSSKLSHIDGMLDVSSFRKVWEVGALGTIMMIGAVYPIMRKQGYGRIINVSSDSIYGMGVGGDSAYPSSKGAIFAITKDIGTYSTKDGIKINAIQPSGPTRMSEGSKFVYELCEKYFPNHLVAPFVCALASEECPVSAEVFSTSGGRAARTTLATFPGHANEKTAEGFLAHFDVVMGKMEDIYVPIDCLDQVSYCIKNICGEDVGRLVYTG